MKYLPVVFAAMIGGLGAVSLPAVAADAKPQSVASVIQNKAGLAGQSITAQGKVVKVNNGIMGRNFVHVQDGSGDAAQGTNNLIVTSTQTAAVGDQVSVTGTVVLNRDFGMGYSYPVLIEQATITKK